MKQNILLQEEFIQWIKSEANLPEETAKSYCSYVSSVNNSFTINHNRVKTNLFDMLKIYVDAGDYLNADDLIVKVFDGLCRKDIDKTLGKASKTIQNWKSGLNQYREFIYGYIEESTETTEVIAENELSQPLAATSYYFTKQDIYTNFTLRIITQNRPNSDICFPVSTIKTLFYRNSEKKFFDEWLDNQLDGTKVLTKDKEFSLSEVSSISVLDDGSVSVEIGGKSFDLYSNTADSSEKFKVNVKQFKQIVLDHIQPKREILDTNKEKLPVLRDITKRIYAEETIKTGKDLRRVGSVLLKKGIINKNDIPGLKAELGLIGRQIHLQLMDSGENAKKSDKAI